MEVTGQVFTTEPTTRRHLFGLTASRKRAALLMELLFQNGFVSVAPYAAVKKFVEKNAGFIGMDSQERTLTGYIGRPAMNLLPHTLPTTHMTIQYNPGRGGATVAKDISAWRELPEKLGLCHKLGWMKFEYHVKDTELDERDRERKLEIPIVTTFIIFNHKEVPLPYHLKQLELPRMGTSKSEAVHEESVVNESVEGSKDDLCVTVVAVHEESVDRQRRERRVSKQHTQIASNPESESIRQTPGDGLDPTQRAELELRDRKRTQILEETLLPALEKSAKKQP